MDRFSVWRNNTAFLYCGLQIVHREVLTPHCAKTWDLCLDIIRDKSLWQLAAKLGPRFLAYLKAFQAMRVGFAEGAFVYGLFVASSPSNVVFPGES
jgi:hypothetical protein